MPLAGLRAAPQNQALKRPSPQRANRPQGDAASGGNNPTREQAQRRVKGQCPLRGLEQRPKTKRRSTLTPVSEPPAGRCGEWRQHPTGKQAQRRVKGQCPLRGLGQRPKTKRRSALPPPASEPPEGRCGERRQHPTGKQAQRRVKGQCPLRGLGQRPKTKRRSALPLSERTARRAMRRAAAAPHKKAKTSGSRAQPQPAGFFIQFRKLPGC